MATIKLSLDSELYSSEVVVRAAHRHTDSYFVEIKSAPSDLVIHLTPKNSGVDTSDLVERLRNDILDEQLRSLVRTETRELHAALAEAALRPAPKVSPKR